MKTRRPLILVFLLYALPAAAQLPNVAPAPWVFQTCNEIKGSIAGAAQNVPWQLGPNVKTWCVFNPSAATEVIYWRLTAAATTTSGDNGEILIGQFQCWGGLGIVQSPQFQLSVNAVTNPHKYFAWECL